jgi:hypothetical protein
VRGGNEVLHAENRRLEARLEHRQDPQHVPFPGEIGLDNTVLAHPERDPGTQPVRSAGVPLPTCVLGQILPGRCSSS